jgi:hypothetical protein
MAVDRENVLLDDLAAGKSAIALRSCMGGGIAKTGRRDTNR